MDTETSNQNPQSQMSEPMPMTGGPGMASNKKKWWIWGGIIALIAIIVIGGLWFWMHKKNETKAATNTTPKFTIGLSLDTYKELRWQKDRDLMIEHAKSLGGTINVLSADSDDQKQISDIENLIAQKVNVLIIVAHDAKLVAPTVEKAHQAGIKVIAYDRLILDSDVDAYVTFDSTLLGKYEAETTMKAVPSTVTMANVALVGGAESDNNSALVRQGQMSVLQPMIDAGKVKIVYDKFTPDWSADEAYASIKDYLDKGGKLDAVIAANDGTAGGVIKALKTHSLDGKVPVSGSDAELPAVQRVVQGTQTMTIYTPFKNLADKAVDLAVQFVNKENPVLTGKTNNGKIDVPSLLLDSIPVTKDNVKSVLIDGGVFTSEEVYGTQ